MQPGPGNLAQITQVWEDGEIWGLRGEVGVAPPGTRVSASLDLSDDDGGSFEAEIVLWEPGGRLDGWAGPGGWGRLAGSCNNFRRVGELQGNWGLRGVSFECA